MTTKNAPQPSKILPGILNCIEYGFNLKTASMGCAPLCEYTYTDNKSVVYGYSGAQNTYQIPDQVDVIVEPEFDNYSLSSVLKTETDFKQAFSVNATESYSEVGFSGSASQGLAYTGSLFQSSDREYFLSFAIQTTYRFEKNMQSATPDADFMAALEVLTKIKNLDTDSDYQSFVNFFETYGTHTVKSGVVGGYIVAESAISKSLIKEQTSIKITESLEASFDDVVSQGSVNVEAMYSEDSFLSQYKSEISTQISAIGGDFEYSIPTYCQSVYANPVLLLGPTGQEVFQPTLMSMAEVATVLRLETLANLMTQAIGRYLDIPVSPLLQPLKPEKLGSSTLQTQDFLLIANMNCTQSGSHGAITAASGSAKPPLDAMSYCSAEFDSDKDAWVPQASCMIPVLNGDYLETKITQKMVPTFSAFKAGIGADDGNSYLIKPTPVTINLGSISNHSFGSDGFFVCTIQSSGSICAGSVFCSNNEGIVGASSVDVNSVMGNRYISQGSFCIPVRQAQEYSLSAQQSAGKIDVQGYFFALSNSMFSKEQNIDEGISYQAETDGILVATLDTSADEGGRGYVELKSAGTEQALAKANTIVATSVHMFIEDSINVPHNTTCLPISKGEWYVADYTPTSGQPKLKVYFVPFTRT